MHNPTDFTQPPGRRIGALALIRDKADAVLMVKPTYKDGWILPGGSALAGERPDEACVRTVGEETGLERFTPGRLLVIDYVPRRPETGSAEGYNLVFNGGVVPTGVDIRLPKASEGGQPDLSAYQFVRLDRLPEFAKPYQERRIRESVAVLRDGRAHTYLVEGRPVL